MFENILAERMTRLHTESAFQILAEANALEAQGRSVIHCEIGQPDFATPEHIIKAAYEAMKAGYTGYSPAPGYPDVRAALAAVTGSQEEVIRMREAFRERRDWVVPALTRFPASPAAHLAGPFTHFRTLSPSELTATPSAPGFCGRQALPLPGALPSALTGKGISGSLLPIHWRT